MLIRNSSNDTHVACRKRCAASSSESYMFAIFFKEQGKLKPKPQGLPLLT